MRSLLVAWGLDLENWCPPKLNKNQDCRVLPLVLGGKFWIWIAAIFTARVFLLQPFTSAIFTQPFCSHLLQPLLLSHFSATIFPPHLCCFCSRFTVAILVQQFEFYCSNFSTCFSTIFTVTVFTVAILVESFICNFSSFSLLPFYLSPFAFALPQPFQRNMFFRNLFLTCFHGNVFPQCFFCSQFFVELFLQQF